MNILGKIKGLFEVDGILVFRDFHGQTCENNRFDIGYRLAGEIDPTAALHEIAHFAELPIERILKNPRVNWDFSYGKYWQIGTSYGYEPQTDQATQRELRTWGYQLSIQRELGIDGSPYDLVKSLVWMNDYCNFKYRAGIKEDKDVISYAADIVEKYSDAQFSYKNFLMSYKERIKALKNQFKAVA